MWDEDILRLIKTLGKGSFSKEQLSVFLTQERFFNCKAATRNYLDWTTRHRLIIVNILITIIHIVNNTHKLCNKRVQSFVCNFLLLLLLILFKIYKTHIG